LADISNFQSIGGVYVREEQERQQQRRQIVDTPQIPQLKTKNDAFMKDRVVPTTAAVRTITTVTASSTTSTTCLTQDCIQFKARELSRAFPDKTNKGDWCLDTQTNVPNKEGILLVKVPKAASSTAAGIALRIANRQNCQSLQWQHKPGVTYAKRDPNKSLLITSIRDPASRVLSYLFFMEVSIQQQPYSEEWILDRLSHFSGRYGGIEDGQGGFTMQFAALEKIDKHSAWSPNNRTHVLDPKQIEERVQRMLEGYDFMLVVDRMDESLVALALTLDIDVGDVLVTSSKVAGSYFYDPPHKQCIELTQSIKSRAVQDYLESDDWKAQNYGDYLLHAAANYSLDLTIERLGRDRFNTVMKRYQMLKQAEKEQCAPKVQFPCSKTGTPQPKLARKQCYARDFGCGYKCIDSMIESFKSHEEVPPLTTQ